MSFLGQLKQRNVFRIGMAYIVSAWVLVQVSDIVLLQFAAPAWVLKFLVLLCFTGFPLALWLAWTFALTPDGLRLEKYVDRSRYAHTTYGQKLDYVVIALIAAVVGLESLERLVPFPDEPSRFAAPVAVPDPVPEEPVVILPNSIAVLPFDNLSEDPNQAYFSDGLADELLNALTRVEGLNVASRTSSFAFRGDPRSVQEIARALRVALLLKGSVRKAGERLRVTVQLIDPASDTNLWSDGYDRDLTDIFLVQEEIASAIVAALQVELGATLQAADLASGTANIDAYDLYLQGRELFIARQNLPMAWDLLQQATHLDPTFARAWETLAATHSVANSWRLPDEALDHDALALVAARRALELDPTLSMPHAVIAMEHERAGVGYAGAIASLDTAITNDPRNATAHLWRGIKWKEMGYLERAQQDFEACLAIDPAYLICQQWRAETLLGLGRVQEAVTAFEATLSHNFHSSSDSFVSWYVKTGQRSMALAVAALALRRQFAPVGEWIEAIEDPEADHAAAVARFDEWGRLQDLDLCSMGMVAVALRQTHCFTRIENARLLWQPDSAWFRQTPAFKEFAKAQFQEVWREIGLPPQCRAVGEQDFACD